VKYGLGYSSISYAFTSHHENDIRK
jgi:hypothetical protein